MPTQQDFCTPEVHTMKRECNQTTTAFRITRVNAAQGSMWSNLNQLNTPACPGIVSWNGTNLFLYVVHLVETGVARKAARVLSIYLTMLPLVDIMINWWRLWQRLWITLRYRAFLLSFALCTVAMMGRPGRCRTSMRQTSRVQGTG